MGIPPIPARPGLGTAPIGSHLDGPLWWGPQDRDVAVATVVSAVEAGVAFVDTAPLYGWGRAEEIVRDALLAGPRQHPPIFTKCGSVRCGDGSMGTDHSPVVLRRDVEESLERLGVDRIDVVQVHDPDPSTPIEPTWELLLGLVDEGLVGGIGLSNHPVELLDRALAVGPVDLVQCEYSLLWRAPEIDGTLRWCRDHGVPMLAWAPLASGFLADGFDLAALDPDDLRHRLRWVDDPGVGSVRAVLGALAVERTSTMVEMAVSWVLSDVVRPIVGARTPVEAHALAGIAPADDELRVRLSQSQA